MKSPDQMYLAITFADGTTGLMGFVICEYNPDDTPRWRTLATKDNVDAVIAQASKLDPETGHAAFDAAKLPVQSWRFVTDEERALFAQRDFRDALVDTGSAIEHDMGKARAIHRERLRKDRGPLLAALDVELQRAEEILNPTEKDAERLRIIGEKQVLRDLTDDPAIDTAVSVEELRSLPFLGLPAVVDELQAPGRRAVKQI